MSTHKRTYALPADMLEQFENQVVAGHRSAVIAGLIREWLDRRRRESLRSEVIEGCREMADLYLEVEREYHSLEEEVQRALDRSPKTGRRRPHSPRSRRRL